MDKQALALLIPIAAMLIPTAAVIMHGLQKIAAMRIEEARARGALSAGGAEELRGLREEVSELRHEMGEMQERLDFTERMLAQQRDRGQLGQGG